MVTSVGAGGREYVVRPAKSGSLGGELAVRADDTRQVYNLPDEVVAE